MNLAASAFKSGSACADGRKGGIPGMTGPGRRAAGALTGEALRRGCFRLPGGRGGRSGSSDTKGPCKGSFGIPVRISHAIGAYEKSAAHQTYGAVSTWCGWYEPMPFPSGNRLPFALKMCRASSPDHARALCPHGRKRGGHKKGPGRGVACRALFGMVRADGGWVLARGWIAGRAVRLQSGAPDADVPGAPEGRRISRLPGGPGEVRLREAPWDPASGSQGLSAPPPGSGHFPARRPGRQRRSPPA